MQGMDPESGEGLGDLTSSRSSPDFSSVENAIFFSDEEEDMRDKEISPRGHLQIAAPDPVVKIALSLYKVQQNIYLLDFQNVTVSTICLFLRSVFLHHLHFDNILG